MTSPTAVGRAGLLLSAAATALFLTVAALGPSVMQPRLAGPSTHPPYAFAAEPSPELVVALTAAAIVLAAAGLALCLWAGGRGWRGNATALAAAGMLVAVAFGVMPPVGSADHLNYAAYGRMAVTGHDPYATAARDLPADPIARAVEPPWREEHSIYGPVATAAQALAALIGGDSVRLTVAVLALLNALVFVAAGLLFHVAARGDPDRQWRAAVLWTANPLLLFHLVAGAHNDTLAIAFAVAALLAVGAATPWRRRGRFEAADAAGTGAAGAVGAGAVESRGHLGAPCRRDHADRQGWPWPRRMAAAGALVGAGAAVKLQAVLAAAGPGWIALPAAVRRLPLLRGLPARGRGPRSAAVLGVLLAGIAAVAVPAYLLAGPHAFDQVRRASDAVSLATPWHLVRVLLDERLGLPVWRPFVQVGALALMFVLCWLLLRALPFGDAGHPDGQPAVPPAAGHGTGDVTAPAAGGVTGHVGGAATLLPAEGAARPLGDEAARAAAAAALAWLMSAPYALPWYDGLGWALLALLPWSRFDGLLLARTAVLSLAYLPARDPSVVAALGMPADLGWLVTAVRAQVIPWALTAILLALVATCLRRRPLPAPSSAHSPPAPMERPR